MRFGYESYQKFCPTILMAIIEYGAVMTYVGVRITKGLLVVTEKGSQVFR